MSYTEKNSVLYYAPSSLNRPDQPWVVTVEGDCIVARWKWMDATWFAPHEVTNDVRDYTFKVKLKDNGKYSEVDTTVQKKSSVKISGGGLSFGSSSSNFKGKTNQKSFQFGVGQNNQSGQAGLIGFKFDTTYVKQAIRAYLEHCGWKKGGLFG